jgi:hypothetical protein
MSDQLTQYFEQYAENAISKMEKSVLAVKFYERLKWRLARGEDLSEELPIIKSVGQTGALEVVNAAIAEYTSDMKNAWAIHPRLNELGKFKVSMVHHEREHIPRATVNYQYASEAGVIKIEITSAAENYKLTINAGKNPMAAKTAVTELEKQLTFISLLDS